MRSQLDLVYPNLEGRVENHYAPKHQHMCFDYASVGGAPEVVVVVCVCVCHSARKLFAFSPRSLKIKV